MFGASGRIAVLLCLLQTLYLEYQLSEVIGGWIFAESTYLRVHYAI